MKPIKIVAITLTLFGVATATLSNRVEATQNNPNEAIMEANKSQTHYVINEGFLADNVNQQQAIAKSATIVNNICMTRDEISCLRQYRNHLNYLNNVIKHNTLSI